MTLPGPLFRHQMLVACSGLKANLQRGDRGFCSAPWRAARCPWASRQNSWGAVCARLPGPRSRTPGLSVGGVRLLKTEVCGVHRSRVESGSAMEAGARYILKAGLLVPPDSFYRGEDVACLMGDPDTRRRCRWRWLD